MRGRDLALLDNVLLREEFDGTAVNENVWTKTDTESKITVASGLLSFSGGMAAPAHGDPGILAIRTIPRLAGLRIPARLRAGTTNAYGPNVTLSTANPFNALGQYQHSILPRNAGYLGIVLPGGTGIDIPVPYVASTWYWVQIALLATGCAYLVSADGIVWDVVWVEGTGSTAVLYLVLHTYSQAGDLDFTKLYRGPTPLPQLSAVPAATVPSYGAELVTNGAFAADTDWTKNAGWTIGGGTANHAGANDSIWQPTILTTNVWYLVTYTVTGWVSGTLTPTVAGSTGPVVGANGAQSFVRQAGATGQLGFASDGTLSIDDVSAKAITLASTLTLIGDNGKKNGTYRCYPTVAADTQAGLAACVDDETNPTYGLFCWTNRTNVTLKKLEAGTWTSLVDTATGVSHTNGRELRLVVNGSSIGVYYESAAGTLSLIGTIQTVTLTSYGTKAAAFDPSGSNTLGSASTPAEAW